jgi:hypothetical protein
MICPRCGKEIPEEETLCPFCMQEIDKNMEFNDFREDGFVQIQSKNELNPDEPASYKPKYFDISEYNIFVIAVVFVLTVSVFTVFSLRFVQKRASIYVPEYISTEPATVVETEPPTIKNTVEKYDIKDLKGSWKIAGDEETDATAIPYLTFGDKGYLQQNYGTVIVKGTYSDISDKNDHGVYLSIDTNFRGAYDFEVKGNKNDGYTLTLTNRTSGGIIDLKKAQANMKKLGRIKNYKVDKRLLGVWLTKDKQKGYKFVDNGRVKRTSNNTITYGVYTTDKKKNLHINYMKEEIMGVDLTYELNKKNNKLIINDTLYIKQK